MENERKTKKQLIGEVIELRRLVAVLNATETKNRQTRAALQESEAMVRNLLEYVPGVSVQGYTTDGIVRSWNKASEEIYGYTEKEAIGRNLGDLIIPPEVKPNFRQALELGAKCTRSGELMPPGELMLLHKNGSLVPVYSIHTVVCLDGRPSLMFCIDVDLSERKRTEEALRKAHNELEQRVEERTAELAKVNDKLRRKIEERKQAEEELRKSEEKYMTMIKYSNDMIWTLDKEGRFTYFNKKSEEITGYRIKEELNKEFGPMILEEDIGIVSDALRRTLQGESLHYEVRIHNAGRSKLITLSINTAPIYKNKGVVGTVSFGRNITEQRQTENALKESAARLQLAISATRIGHWDWDSQTDEMYFSPEWKRQLGYEGHEIHNRFEEWESRLHPDDRQRTIKAVEDYIADRRADYAVEFRLRHKDGSYRWIYTRAEKQLDDTGKPYRVFGCHVDITERKQAEETLRKSHTEIKQLKDRLQAESDYLRAEIKLTTHSHREIVGKSEAINKVLLQLEQVAPTESSVLITGKSGTGKELVARAIHNFSKRKDRVMVKVDCASLPSALVESELFGRQKGAYTGALTSQLGRFEVADGSSIFLDEIGELSPELQVKLLRVLQEGEFERLGSPKTIRVNVRVIAATNRDLSAEMRKGNFREDLYYRLNVFHIEVPPLRERPDDIPLLVWTFANEFAEKMGKKIQTVPKRTMEALQRYHWPGNVRELRNVIEHAAIISTSDILKVKLPQDPRGVTSRILTLKDAEHQHITKVLERTNWRIKGPHGAAELLGLKPSTLYTRMNKLGIPTGRNKDAIPT